ncbi:MAG: helix-turn-helix transcriptional regulator [Oscillospiraceae bacterium]|nr:helix-turn-helix transcriptional regulator [Oscillospiraceae bacterium]
MDNIKTGNLIRELRTEKGITQKELAERLNVSTAAVSKWENGHGFPDISLLEPLSAELDISVTEIIKGEKNPESKVEDSIAKDIIELSKKERKFERTGQIFIVSALGLTIISIVSYIVFDAFSSYERSMEFSVESSGLIGLFSFLFGANAVFFALFNLFFGKKYSVRKAMQTGLFSEACCAGALWLAFVYINYKVSIGDVSAVLDTAEGLEFYARILLLTTVYINAFAYHNIVKEK